MAAAEFVQPVHQALRGETDGRATPLFPALVNRRASDTERYLAGNGSTYSAFVDAFRRARGFYGRPLRLHIMPRERSIDIDTAEDLALARFFGQHAGLQRKMLEHGHKRTAARPRTARKKSSRS
jgi:N-acylneuraminate cytidylyltransferase